MRTEVPDAALDVQLAVGANRHESVMAYRSRGMRADRDTDAAHLVAVALPGTRHAVLPAEALGAAIECLFDERARRVGAPAVPLGAEGCLAGGCVDLPHLELIDPELGRGLRDRLLDDGDALHLAR